MEEILHQLIGSLSHYLQGFIHPRWLFGISSINSMAVSKNHHFFSRNPRDLLPFGTPRSNVRGNRPIQNVCILTSGGDPDSPVNCKPGWKVG